MNNFPHRNDRKKFQTDDVALPKCDWLSKLDTGTNQRRTDPEVENQRIGHFTMASFYYNYQNPSGFCFIMLIRAIVLCSPLGLQNLNLKRKTK